MKFKFLSRRFLVVLGALLLLWFGLVIYAIRIEPSMLRSRRIEVAAADPRWRGELRIAIAGDMHFRPQDAPRLERMTAQLNAFDADLVLLLGDYFRGRDFDSALPLEEIAAGLGRIESRLGTWAILGNHDWWCGGEETRAALERHGVAVLENTAVLLEIAPGVRINLAGVGDRFTGHDDLAAALAAADPAWPTLLMSHHPDLQAEVPAGQVALTVSGHTHGGQVRIPFWGAPVVPSAYGQRFADGLVEEEGRPPLFVTRGVGNSILEVRFNCPPEVVLMTVKR